MSFKLKVEKFVERGEKKWRILGWEGCMRREETPKEYTSYSKKPWFYLSSYTDKIIVNVPIYDYNYNIRVGNEYEESEFNELLDTMLKAGIRLHTLREEVKELEKNWRGKETFVI